MILKRIAGISLLASICSIAVASPQYINPKPLADLKVSYGPVTDSNSVMVPVITWPADMKTIYANGDSAQTGKGSLFDKMGLNVSVHRVDGFDKQLKNFVAGKTPYLRGTLGMINASKELLAEHGIEPVVIYQMSWSAGGDAVVVKDHIKSLSDLKGKTIGLQAYGPHVDYMAKVLKDAGVPLDSVKLKWVKDLTGTENSPAEALFDSDVDAVFVITPDALALTSNGKVGTGAEGSVKGARIALDTASANRIISDVYAVRSDYLKARGGDVEKFVSALMQADEKVVETMRTKGSGYQKMLKGSAKILFDSTAATGEVEGFFGDAQLTDVSDNRKFLTDDRYPRNINKMSQEIQQALIGMGMLKSTSSIQAASWNFDKLASGITTSSVSRKQTFDESKVAALVSRKQKAGTLSEDGEFSFEVLFKPNQKSFPMDLYGDDFAKAIEMASAYSGAIITVEGHSDPMGFLRAKKKGQNSVVLNRLKQSGKNLSFNRAQEVRNALIDFSNTSGVTLDPSQFALVGYGISNPATGVCGSDPCAPQTKGEWLSNMRVVFRMIPVSAEEDVFQPL